MSTPGVAQVNAPVRAGHFLGEVEAISLLVLMTF
jgi:hypothetical protein